MRGDIVDTLKNLEGKISSTGDGQGRSLPEDFGKAISLCAHNSNLDLIPVSHAERLLSMGQVMLDGTKSIEQRIPFSQSKKFVESLMSVISISGARKETQQQVGNVNESPITSISSHSCFEFAIRTVLGMIDKSALLTRYVKTAGGAPAVRELLRALGQILVHDELYLTQVNKVNTDIT